MKDSLPFIKKRIEEEKPALAVIDGIVDLLQDFNDIKQSSDVSGKALEQGFYDASAF